jgi:hypothetical protein
MPSLDFTVQQLVVVRIAMTPKVVAKSAGVDFVVEEFALRAAVKFGPRPVNVACPAAVFAHEIDAKRIVIVQAADRADGSADPPLAFRFLIFSRELYSHLGDPFAIADRYPPNFDARGSLPELAWPEEPLPPRKVGDLHAILKAGDGPFLLGTTQALLDGAHVAVVRPAPDPELARNVWQLLPDRIRCDLWPATFAFAGDLNFHFAVVASPVKGSLSEEQAKDYPEGRYESALQVAIESSDQAELDRLLARKPSVEVLRLAVGMVVFAVIVAVIVKFV